jgi:radical SAM protein with 4Fe4S-binding SPASM domain
LIELSVNEGVANARNKGAEAAKGDILVFFDSDIVIEKDTLSKFAKAHEDPYTKVCQCQIYPMSLSKGFAPELIGVMWHHIFNVMGKHPSYLSTMAFSMDKELFNEIGGFNPYFASSGGEEFEIGEQIKRYGHLIHADHSFSVYHHYQGFWPRCKTLFRRSYVYGKIVFNRKFKFDKGHGTMKEGVNSMLSMSGAPLLASSLFIPNLFLLFLSTIVAQTFLDAKENGFIIKKKGLSFFFKSIPLKYIWYMSMGLGVVKAGVVNYTQKIISPFKRFSFLFSKTPAYVIFFVTAVCNARCKHCFYWEKVANPDISNELTLDEVKKISKNFDKIEYMTYSGGEPSLRKDIVEVTQTFYKNNKLSTLNFITNGFAPVILLQKIKDILRTCPELELMVSFSLDGVEKQHDDIRKVPGGFEKLVKSVKEIKKLQKHHKNLKTFAITTHTKYNEDNLPEIVSYITKKLGLELCLNYVRGEPLEKEAKDIKLKDYNRTWDKLVQINEVNSKKGFGESMIRALNNLSSKLIVKTLNGKERTVKCVTGTKQIEIAEDGTIFPCEMMNVNYGNIRDFDYDIKKVLDSDKAKRFTKQIERMKCHCTWECAMKNNIVYNPKQYPSLILEWVKLFLTK